MNFNDDKENSNDNSDHGYIDDKDSMLGDICTATVMGINEDMAPYTVGPKSVKSKPTTSFSQLGDVRYPLYDGYTTFLKLSFIVKLFYIKIVAG